MLSFNFSSYLFYYGKHFLDAYWQEKCCTINVEFEYNKLKCKEKFKFSLISNNGSDRVAIFFFYIFYEVWMIAQQKDSFSVKKTWNFGYYSIMFVSLLGLVDRNTSSSEFLVNEPQTLSFLLL